MDDGDFFSAEQSYIIFNFGSNSSKFLKERGKGIRLPYLGVSAFASSPVPNVSESCKDLVLVLVDRGGGIKKEVDIGRTQ